MTEDHEIVALFFLRDERAIRLTEEKYGRYLTATATRLLCDPDMAKDVTSDAYLDAWNSIPPQRPEKLGAYMTKLLRRRAIDRLRKENAARRGGGEAYLSIHELSDCIASPDSVESALDEKELGAAITSFLSDLPEDQRRIFLCRYFYAMTLREIAGLFAIREARAANILMRLRVKLKGHLIAHGYLTDERPNNSPSSKF